MADAGGEAAPDAGAAPDGGGDAGGQSAPDFQQLIGDATAPLQQELESMRGLLETYAPAQEQQQQQQPGQDVFGGQQQPQQQDLSYLDPDSPNYDAQQAAQAFLQMVSQQQQQQLSPVTSQVEQLQTQIADMRAEGEYRQLADEFPDLQQKEISDKVFEAATQWTAQLVQTGALPQDQAQKFAESAPALRAVYMMGRASEAASAEASEQQPGVASLEGPGGGAPAAAPSGGLSAESIVSAGRGSVLPI